MGFWRLPEQRLGIDVSVNVAVEAGVEMNPVRPFPSDARHDEASILRVPRGESRRSEARKPGILRAKRAQNDKSWGNLCEAQRSELRTLRHAHSFLASLYVLG